VSPFCKVNKKKNGGGKNGGLDTLSFYFILTYLHLFFYFLEELNYYIAFTLFICVCVFVCPV
jgi:hypothetical protein